MGMLRCLFCSLSCLPKRWSVFEASLDLLQSACEHSLSRKSKIMYVLLGRARLFCLWHVSTGSEVAAVAGTAGTTTIFFFIIRNCACMLSQHQVKVMRAMGPLVQSFVEIVFFRHDRAFALLAFASKARKIRNDYARGANRVAAIDTLAFTNMDSFK